MGTPEFSVPALAALRQNFSILGVYTQPDRPFGRGLGKKPSPVKKKALELGLPVFKPQHFDADEVQRLRLFNPDLIVVVAYGQILKRDVLDIPRFGCVNIHSSLLPRWRGAAPIQRAILSGDSETGVTTMQIVEKLDAGGVLMQKKTRILEEDTAETLHDRLSHLGAELIVPTVQGVVSGQLQSVEQDETQVTYAKKLTKEMEWLDLHESADVLQRRIRALNPWPGTSVQIQDGKKFRKKLMIRKAKLHRGLENQGEKGIIFEKAGTLFLEPRGGGGTLELLTLQWEGKKAVGAAVFLNGFRGDKNVKTESVRIRLFYEEN